MWRRLVAEGEAAGPGREAQIEAARRAHAQGFVAEAIEGLERQVAAFLDRTARRTPEAGVGAGEPTMEHLINQKGDTVHIDVVDRWGNMMAATPSGGWLKSNPVIPGLGVPLARGRRYSGRTRGCPPHLPPSRGRGRR